MRNATRKIIAASLLTFVASTAPAQSTVDSAETRLACEALIHARGLQLALPGALFGRKQSFPAISESLLELVRVLRSYAKIMPSPPESFIVRIRENADILLSHEDKLLKVYHATRAIAQSTVEVQKAGEAFSSQVVAAGSTPTQIVASNMLLMLNMRIGKSSAELLSYEGLDPESIFLLKRDPETFRTIAVGMREGNAKLQVTAVKTVSEKEHLSVLLRKFEQTRGQADIVTSNFLDVVAAKKAQNQLHKDLEFLDKDMQGACFGRKDKSTSGLSYDWQELPPVLRAASRKALRDSSHRTCL